MAQFGVKLETSVTRATHILVCGSGVGAKTIEDAKKKGIQVWTANDFWENYQKPQYCAIGVRFQGARSRRIRTRLLAMTQQAVARAAAAESRKQPLKALKRASRSFPSPRGSRPSMTVEDKPRRAAQPGVSSLCTVRPSDDQSGRSAHQYQYHMPPARPSFTRFWKDNSPSRVTTPAFFSGAGAAAGTFGGAPAMGTVVSEAERRRPPSRGRRRRSGACSAWRAARRAAPPAPRRAR